MPDDHTPAPIDSPPPPDSTEPGQPSALEPQVADGTADSSASEAASAPADAVAEPSAEPGAESGGGLFGLLKGGTRSRSKSIRRETGTVSPSATGTGEGDAPPSEAETKSVPSDSEDLLRYPEAWRLPGTIAPDPNAPPPQILATCYRSSEFMELGIEDPAAIHELLKQWPVTWVHVRGLGNAEIIKQLGEVFKLHPLAMEDVVNTYQRAKVDDYSGHYFIVLRTAEVRNMRFATHQISMFLGTNFLLTFQEQETDPFAPVRDRIRHNRGKVRQEGPDYLAYTLIDGLVDDYFPLVETFADAIEDIEEIVAERPDKERIGQIHELRQSLLALRRTVWPLRDAVNSISRNTLGLFRPESMLHMRDCSDHCSQLIELVETYRELCNGLMELYLTALNNRMNEVMKMLTIIATIFIPLTFVTSVYGMNFDHMPELHWEWGYPLIMAINLAIGGGLVWYFRRRDWL